MDKTEMNNEFILLRHAVRQARVCIVNKLIKEAKLLRDRHGNEAQREKCRRKADKLIAEVYALKTIKDDDISKFGILDERSLTKILQDQSSSSDVRIMARVVYYKTLNKRLIQFKERFPDCKKHLAENKKKKTRKPKEKNIQSKSSKKQKVDLDKNVERKSKDVPDELSEVRNSSRKRKKTSTKDEDCTSLEKQKLLKLEKDEATSEAMDTDKQSSVIKSSSVTKEATVKRFAELLEEQKVNQNAQMSENQDLPAGTTTEQGEMIDDFFITGDNQSYQENDPSTSYVRSPRHNTRSKSKVFQSNDRVKKENTNRKSDTNFSKRHSAKQSFSTKSKKTPNRINKNPNKNNANENAIVKKDENVNLHPSWMAKKKEQETIKRGFQGKRIVFADD